jgi:hypothetical protein
MKTRVIMVLVLLLLSALISGCGSNGSKNTESSEEKTSSSSSVNTESDTEAESAETNEDIPDSISDTAIEDLNLFADKKEICIGKDDNEVIFVAGDISEPYKVELVNADTDETVGEMLDDAEFERSGDDIMGDARYSLRYKVDDTFPTEPDVSEDRTYRFYARYTDGNTVHRSNTAEVFVYETFTDKELETMDTVDSQIEELVGSDDYLMLDTEGRKEKVTALLEELIEQGLVDKGSIASTEDIISYSVGGVSSGVMLRPFDDRMN